MIELNKIYNEDCLKGIERIDDKSIDLILQDPPYNITQCNFEWDIMTKIDEFWTQWKRIIKSNGVIVFTTCQPFTSKLIMSNLEMFKYEWIWEKTQATGHFNARKRPMVAHEQILVFYASQPTYNPQKTEGHEPLHSHTKYLKTINKTEVYGKCKKEISGGGNTDRFPRSVIKFASDKQTCYLHPSQKPVALFEYLIKTYTNESDIVYDGFMGSGTTAVACIETGRNYIGFEIEKKYYDIAQKRIDDKLKNHNINKEIVSDELFI